MYLGSGGLSRSTNDTGGAQVMRRWLLMIVLAATFLALSSGGAAAFAQPHQSTVSIGGAGPTPATYSLSQLEALPPPTRTTFGGRRSWWGSRIETDEGMSLEDLVTWPARPSRAPRTRCSA